jgi:hypothetical protein
MDELHLDSVLVPTCISKHIVTDCKWGDTCVIPLQIEVR